MSFVQKTVFLGDSVPSITLDTEGNIHLPEGVEPGDVEAVNAPLLNQRGKPISYDSATSRWTEVVDSLRTGDIDRIDLYAPASAVDYLPPMTNMCRGGFGSRGRVGIDISATLKPMTTVLPKGKAKKLEARELSYVYVKLEVKA